MPDSPHTCDWADHPVIVTERLRLRRVELDDAPAIQRHAGDFDVARMTAAIPHPYEDGAAEEWLKTIPDSYRHGKAVVFAITAPPDDDLIGTIGLTFAWEHERAEIGYWLGKPFWGRGYATEAARAVVNFAFDRYASLRRVHAGAYGHNPASQRVLVKSGLMYEGTRRRHLVRFGESADVVDFGLLRTEWMPEGGSQHSPGLHAGS